MKTDGRSKELRKKREPLSFGKKKEIVDWADKHGNTSAMAQFNLKYSSSIPLYKKQLRTLVNQPYYYAVQKERVVKQMLTDGMKATLKEHPLLSYYHLNRWKGMYLKNDGRLKDGVVKMAVAGKLRGRTKLKHAKPVKPEINWDNIDYDIIRTRIIDLEKEIEELMVEKRKFASVLKLSKTFARKEDFVNLVKAVKGL